MFGISSLELLVILLVALVVLGPEKLPKLMRTAGKVMSEFRKVSTDLQRAMNAEIASQEEEELSKKIRNNFEDETTTADSEPSSEQDTSAPEQKAEMNKNSSDQTGQQTKNITEDPLYAEFDRRESEIRAEEEKKLAAENKTGAKI